MGRLPERATERFSAGSGHWSLGGICYPPRGVGKSHRLGTYPGACQLETNSGRQCGLK